MLWGLPNSKKNVEKMSARELRAHVKELREQNYELMTELRVSLELRRLAHARLASYQFRLLCGCVALFLIVGLLWYYYYK